VSNDDLLRRDVRLLGDMLDSVIVELAGPTSSALVEDIRGLARDRRAGRHDAERALAAKIESLDVAQAECVTRALSASISIS
jgi:phosphoenolpyruvate carboxylase